MERLGATVILIAEGEVASITRCKAYRHYSLLRRLPVSGSALVYGPQEGVGETFGYFSELAASVCQQAS